MGTTLECHLPEFPTPCRSLAFLHEMSYILLLNYCNDADVNVSTALRICASIASHPLLADQQHRALVAFSIAYMLVCMREPPLHCKNEQPSIRQTWIPN